MGIEVLSSDVVGKIAAGEVVERPGSVVKELVENAVDAGARSIQVEIATGGCDLIRVADDGCGIAREELFLAVERHATSKIRSADDLGRIATLGFRGEALASIAAVSEMTVVSRRAETSSASEIHVVGGALDGGVVSASRAPGTTVLVEKLFFNVPARRKFLRSAAAEAGQVVRLVSQLALAYPEVAFTLFVDGRRPLITSGSGELLDAALAVLGREVADALLPIEGLVEADRPIRSVAARIHGYAADPGVSRSTRSGVSLFVNRRPIRSRSLGQAVEDGYQTLLQVGRYPIALISLEVPPAEVDVNVHPSKSEVRLFRERLIYAGLRDAVRSAVADSSGWAKELSPTGRGFNGVLLDPSGQPRLMDTTISGPSAGEDVMVGGRRLPILRVIGQVAQTYIVAEGDVGIYLIDQHAAHERVLLERLEKSTGQDGNTQLMLEPISIEVTPPEWEIVTSATQALEVLGYRLEQFGEKAILIRGIPTELPAGRAVEALKEALGDLAEEKPEAADWRERLKIALSCRGAVKAGQILAPEEMRSLVIALEDMDITQHCSHGRPTAVLLSRNQLEREFGRR